MSTTTITHRPISAAAAVAAVVAAVAIGGLTIAQDRLGGDTQPTAPAQQHTVQRSSDQGVNHGTRLDGELQGLHGPTSHVATTSGGKVMLGS